MLRKQLFHQLGEDLARAILAQSAHHSGWNDAQLLLQELPFDNLEAMLSAQYGLLGKSGFGVFTVHDLAVNKAASEVYIRVVCRNSPEAESHRRLFGTATLPACCHLVGYSSGWASAVMGMQVLTIETRCMAKNDEYCEFETLPYEDFFGPEALFWKRAFEDTSRSLAQELKEQLHTIQRQLSLIQQQRITLAALAAPILQIADGVLALPIIGGVDGERATMITEKLLETIIAQRAWGIIIDVTAVESIDNAIAQSLSRMVSSARFLGGRVVLTGIAPAVAQVLVTQDVRLADVQTCRSLQDGIRFLKENARRNGQQ
jgi:anti-anti-sigma regulatory factor/predicted hydrocarbon binding protein